MDTLDGASMNTKQRFEDAFNALKVLGVPVYIHPDDRAPRFSISAEDEGADEWVSMYHGDPDWLFGVNPVVHLVLNRFELFAEWVNPGRLSVYDNALEPPIIERNEP